MQTVRADVSPDIARTAGAETGAFEWASEKRVILGKKKKDGGIRKNLEQ